MPTFDFSGPFLKIERAEQHINQLENMLSRYVADNRQRLRPERQKRLLKQGRAITFASPHKHTPTVLGDALHNLRVSLDHAYCILIQANGHSPADFSRFPFTKDWESMKGSIKGHVATGNGPSEAVVKFIGGEIQPFPGGKHNLFDLHRLDIADKHQCILPTSPRTTIAEMDVARPDGEVAATFRNLRIGGNLRTLISGGTAIMKNEMQNAFDVTFGKGQPFEGRAILPTIQRLRGSTFDALKGLESFL